MKKVKLTALAIAMALFCSFALTACGGGDKRDAKTKQASFVASADDNPTYTYNTFTAVSPSNWNELTYLDNNDTQIMNYIQSPFFEFDYQFDKNGNIVSGKFDVEYSFATGLEDVTADYVGQYGIEEGNTQKVWKITIRNDGMWDDGTPIKAGDFVYSMQEQLNPLFRNRRADSFYNGSVNIYNAWEYVFQGSKGYYDATKIFSTYDSANDKDLYFCFGPYKYKDENDKDVSVDNAMRTSWGFPASYDAASTLAYMMNYIGLDVNAEVVAKMEGKSLKDIKADSAMNAELLKIATWWVESETALTELPDEILELCVADAALPELDFSEVGMFAPDDTHIVIALTKGINFIDADGNLTYHAPYEFSSLPLVKRDLYEKCKIKPTTEGGLWTTNYNTSKETTASWGPYMLTDFQKGKTYTLSRNTNWYGYNMEKYAGQYQTDAIKCSTVSSYSTQLLMFRNGQIDDLGIDVSIADDYKNSERAYYTPDDFVGSFQLQSNVESLKNRGESEGVNKMLLKYQDFRKALSIGFDRADFVYKCTTSSKAGFGLYNSMHYYDVANGGVYRDTDYAKKALCDVYGIDVSKFASLDDAVDAITGYDLDQARALVTKAYNEALAAGDIKATDKVKFTMGTGVVNETIQRRFDYIKAAWTEMLKGTPLEGRFDMELKDFESDWAKAFTDRCEYDICMGGWNGAAWNPGYFIMAYLNPDYMYSKSWDTSSHILKATVHGAKLNDEGQIEVTNDKNDVFEAELPLYTDSGDTSSWYQLLNSEDYFGDGSLDPEFRCELLAQMEAEVLKQAYSIPFQNSYAASMLSFKVDYVTYEYNTFMGYGGIQYMKYNYSDKQWKEFRDYMGEAFDYR